MKFEKRMIEDYCCVISFSELHFFESREIENCINIIKNFTKGDKYFFGLYREDGNFKNHDDTIKYRLELPEFFINNGNYVDLTKDKFKQGKHYDPRISAVGSLLANEDTYKMIPNICNYYLETIFFEPKKSWEDFESTYCSNTMQSSTYFIKNEYADLIFSYVDSGTFYIQFNTNKFNPETVIDDIERIIFRNSIYPKFPDHFQNM